MGLLGGLIGGAVGGLFGGSDPQYARKGISDSGEAALQDTEKRADRSVEDRTNQQMSGVSEAAKPFTQMDTSKPGEVNDALQKRIDRKSDIAMNRLKRQTSINAVDQKNNERRIATNLRQAQYQINKQQADFMLKAARDKEVSVNQAIGGIFGGVGQWIGQRLNQPSPATPVKGGMAGGSYTNFSQIA